jgi:hypothetical protein
MSVHPALLQSGIPELVVFSWHPCFVDSSLLDVVPTNERYPQPVGISFNIGMLISAADGKLLPGRLKSSQSKAAWCMRFLAAAPIMHRNRSNSK